MHLRERKYKAKKYHLLNYKQENFSCSEIIDFSPKDINLLRWVNMELWKQQKQQQTMMVLYKPLKISTKLKLLRVSRFRFNERRREIDKLARKHYNTVNKLFFAPGRNLRYFHNFSSQAICCRLLIFPSLSLALMSTAVAVRVCCKVL